MLISSKIIKSIGVKLYMEYIDEKNTEYEFYKNNSTDLVWWVDSHKIIGEHLFSFDKKKIYNLFTDYPYAMTEEEIAVFNRENPFWSEFFQNRFEN